MRLPVDTSAPHFVPAGPFEPVVDFDTKQPKVDPNGVAVNQVHLFVVGDGGTREVITVKLASEVRGLGQFTPTPAWRSPRFFLTVTAPSSRPSFILGHRLTGHLDR